MLWPIYSKITLNPTVDEFGFRSISERLGTTQSFHRAISFLKVETVFPFVYHCSERSNR
jgi:hypothetical protein